MEKMQLGIELERELFLLSVVLGCGLGLLYDIFRVFRVALPHGKILTFFEDIIYTFLYGFALFTFCTGLTGAIRGVCFSRYANRLCDRTSYCRKRCCIRTEKPFFDHQKTIC